MRGAVARVHLCSNDRFCRLLPQNTRELPNDRNISFLKVNRLPQSYRMNISVSRKAEVRDLGVSWTLLLSLLCFIISTECEDSSSNSKRAYSDSSIDAYFSERTCWWNEVCKREFQVRFRCRCPRWSFCRSPGRYFDAYCSITRTGYIWLQHAADIDD